MRRELVGLAILLSLALAGCGGSDGKSDRAVATAGGGAGAEPAASSSPGAAGSDADRSLQFARCMRENGVDVPDPEPGANRPNLRAGNGDADPQKVRAALEKCRALLPNGGQRPAADPARVEQLRKLAQCIRDNGVPDFPDPDADGRIPFQNLDRNDPKLGEAREKCQQYAPNLGGPGR